MDQLLRWLLRSIVKRGHLRMTTARGTVITVGDGSGAPVAVRITSPQTERAILLHPELKLGEAYMDGTFVVEQGSIADFLELIFVQDCAGDAPGWIRPRALVRHLCRRLQQYNPRPRARRNVAHHYDLDARLYSLFLDSDLQYSCAYFETPAATLDDAQLAKKRHLAAKLMLREPRQRVLDIGCGWGGLALYLAELAEARVTGITLSREQLEIARRRASEQNLDAAVQFRMQDYRDVADPLRPDRFGRYVRACRRRPLRRVLSPMRAASLPERRDGAAFHRPPRGTRHHQPVDRKIYLPGRLHPVALGSPSGDRARGDAGHRH